MTTPLPSSTIALTLLKTLSSSLKTLTKTPPTSLSFTEHSDAAELEIARKGLIDLLDAGAYDLKSDGEKNGYGTVYSKLVTMHERFVRIVYLRIKAGKRYALRCYFNTLKSLPSSSFSSPSVYNIKSSHGGISGLVSVLLSPNDNDEDTYGILNTGIKQMIKTDYLIYIDVKSAILGNVTNFIGKAGEIEGDMDVLVTNVIALVGIVEGYKLKGGDGGDNVAVGDDDGNAASDRNAALIGGEIEEPLYFIPHDVSTDENGENEESEPKAKKQKTSQTKKQKHRLDPKAPFQTINLKLTTLYLTLLRSPTLKFSAAHHKAILSITPSGILSVAVEPLLFADYLSNTFTSSLLSTSSTPANPLLSILSLNALFLLITNHNLSYPEFYTSLYALCLPSTFHLSYRSRFLRLLDRCLRSTHVPTYFLAAFCKRLCRSCLSSPPVSIIPILTIVSNVIRRQEVILKPLISRTQMSLMSDPFDAHTNDPSKTLAIDSSLWEILTLKQHYLPQVSLFARSFCPEGKVALLDVEGQLSWNYKVLFSEVAEKKSKKEGGGVALEFRKPKDEGEFCLWGEGVVR